MIAKKICMLGTFGVGKTSLVQQYVHSMYDERYLTTIGAKVDKKELTVDGRELKLMVWDLHGDDEFQQVKKWQLRGSAGFLLVADGTRRPTLDAAISIQEHAAEELGPVPFVFLVNKLDLRADWEIGAADLEALEERGWTSLSTSAKSGEGVERAFELLGRKILKP